jgi:hypothetical protein
MIMSWIRSMLGPFVVIMDFFSAHPEILTAILTLWMALYVAGRIQLKLIEQRTVRLVVDRSRRLVAANPQISLADLRAYIVPVWLEEIVKWNILFIPHKFDFWPVPVTPKNVQVKLPLSPEWLTNVLKTNGIILSGFQQ